MSTQPPEGTVYKASDGRWYRSPNPTPFDSEDAARASGSGVAGAPPFPPPGPQTQTMPGWSAGTANAKEAKAQAKADKAYAKASRPWYKKKRVLVPVAFLILIIAIASSQGGNDAQKIGTTDNAAGTADDGEDQNKSQDKDSGPSTFGVGDIVKKGDLEASILKVEPNYVSANEFERPEAGKKIVAVQLNLKNNGDDAEHISTLLQFQLKDASNAQYTITLMGPDPRFPDGELTAGDTVQGYVPFEVPATATGLKFIFDADVFGGGKIVWDLAI